LGIGSSGSGGSLKVGRAALKHHRRLSASHTTEPNTDFISYFRHCMEPPQVRESPVVRCPGCNHRWSPKNACRSQSVSWTSLVCAGCGMETKRTVKEEGLGDLATRTGKCRRVSL
jgi:hypothetical protein